MHQLVGLVLVLCRTRWVARVCSVDADVFLSWRGAGLIILGLVPHIVHVVMLRGDSVLWLRPSRRWWRAQLTIWLYDVSSRLAIFDVGGRP